jgi:hypothetical protein
MFYCFNDLATQDGGYRTSCLVVTMPPIYAFKSPSKSIYFTRCILVLRSLLVMIGNQGVVCDITLCSNAA